MMKAAQPGVGGGLPLGSGPNVGSHSPSQHQQMHSGKCKWIRTRLCYYYIYAAQSNVRNRN